MTWYIGSIVTIMLLGLVLRLNDMAHGKPEKPAGPGGRLMSIILNLIFICWGLVLLFQKG